MLENRKNVSKIKKIVRSLIMATVVLLVALLSVYIGIEQTVVAKTTASETTATQAKESKSMVAGIIEHAESSINLGAGTINPTYKPEWTKVGSSLDINAQKLTVTIKGTAYKTEVINENVTINYASDVLSSLTQEDITVYVDGVEVTSVANPKLELSEGTSEVNETTEKVEVTYTIVLSNLEEAVRQSGALYKEWSGNISIKIAGRGEDESTYDENVLVDEFGNQNMMETDEGQAVGTWIDVKIGDTATDMNTDGTMFADFIKPEFTYIYNTTDIDYEGKKVTVVFDVVDKYFASSILALSDLTILVDGVEPDWTKVTKEITSTDNVTGTVNGTSKVVGKRYTLVLSHLEQNPNNAFDYSGIVTIGIPAGKVTDKSGNTNNGTTIAVGMDLPENMPYIPEGYSYVEGTFDTGIVIADPDGNEYVWVEVPKTAFSSKTLSLDLDSLTGTALEEAYEKIYKELDDYSTYGNKAIKDEWPDDLVETYTGLTQDEYTELKQKMLKSIFKNGGFYVGRYETGIEDTDPDVNEWRTSDDWGSGIYQTPVIKKNAYIYNYLSLPQAQQLVSEEFSTEGYEASVIFGLQWDLMLKYIENKGTPREALTTNGYWGNYIDVVVEIDGDAKWTYGSPTPWNQGPVKKEAGQGMGLSPGASKTFYKQNISDLAGNYGDMTLELYNIETPVTVRGGAFLWKGNIHSANTMSSYNNTIEEGCIPRVTLFKDETIEETEPYIPEGYTQIDSDEDGTLTDELNNGLVIQDSKGNQYVWVEVPKTAEVYATAGLGITEFNSANLGKIETDLHNYTSEYRDGTTYQDIWASGNGTDLTSKEYQDLKEEMLISVYENGGFYVGRYETGIDYSENPRYAIIETTQTPVIKQNAYPYNMLTVTQAQKLASSEHFATEGYQTSLMFGVQWDLILKYIETKAVQKGENVYTIKGALKSNSTSWGNYHRSEFTTTTNAKYLDYSNVAEGWKDGICEKTSEERPVLLSTGAVEEFSKQNIYDLAGNLWEQTLEFPTGSGQNYVVRAGSFNDSATAYIKANNRRDYAASGGGYSLGFRVALFKEPQSTPAIVDVVDPIWELVEEKTDLEEKKVTIRAIDKFIGTNTITNANIDEKIILKVNGQESTITKEIVGTPKYLKLDQDGNYIETTNQQEAIGIEYTLQLGNITGGADTELVPFKPTNQEADNLMVDVNENGEGEANYRNQLSEDGYAYYRSENGGNLSLLILEDTAKDTSGNGNKETELENIGYVDITQPEVHHVKTIQDATNNKVAIIFNVTDRNYDSSDKVTLDIDKDGDGTVDPEISIFMDNVRVDSLLANASLTSKPIVANINSEDVTVGHQYILTVNNIAEATLQTSPAKTYLEWSGTLKIEIDEDAAKDYNENTINPDTTTITEFVDFINPLVTKVTVAEPINTTTKTYTMSFTITDKYINEESELTPEEITVYIDGETVPSTAIIEKPETEEEKLANADKMWIKITPEPITASCNKTIEGAVVTGTHTVGYTYTVELSNFEQLTKQTIEGETKDFYEWSGKISLLIGQTAVEDTTGNTLKEGTTTRSIEGEHVDFIKPKVEVVSTSLVGGTETIYFNVIDKYLNTDDVLVLDNDISIYVDDELTTGLGRVLTRLENQDITATVNNQEVVVGHKYKLEISGFEKASRNAKGYKDWSGTVSIKIHEGAVTDKGPAGDGANPNGNVETTIKGDFVDVVKPDLKYTHSASDINASANTYTMTFDVTDKYYESGELSLDDLNIIMWNGQYEREYVVPDGKGQDEGAWQDKLDENEKKIPIVYDLKEEARKGNLTIALDVQDKFASQAVKITDATSGEVVTKEAGTHQIGHTYILRIGSLQPGYEFLGLSTLRFSGYIDVTIDGGEDAATVGGQVLDRAGLTNNETTLSVGENTPDDGTSAPVVVDVVEPVWAGGGSVDLKNKTATVSLQVSDTYFKDSTLTSDKLKLFANGIETMTGVTISEPVKQERTESNYEERYVDEDTTESVLIKDVYTVTVTGFPTDVNQLSLEIASGAAVDHSNNYSGTTKIIFYNVLKSAVAETQPTSGFLGSASNEDEEVAAIQRQNIEQIKFEDYALSWWAHDAIGPWDVSAQGDNSIQAWATQTADQESRGTYTVHIYSHAIICGNVDSTNLFKNIGRGDNCTAEETFINLDKLRTINVQNMTSMFEAAGYTAMKELDLGTLDTRNVTDMTRMFAEAGHEAMETFSIGSNFNTGSVTEMKEMFQGFGHEMLEELDLGGKFDTKNVRSMVQMFYGCGKYAMTSLNLREKFDTSNVTDMARMFCGTSSLEMLDLGDLFDTSKVTDMNGMFADCGIGNLIELDLGEKFNTGNVVDMTLMFYGCGTGSLKHLDLGDLFDTRNVKSMIGMFQTLGEYTLETLDLGPAFVSIASSELFYDDYWSGTWLPGNDQTFHRVGKSGVLTIYAPESIYANQSEFKLNRTSETTIFPENSGGILRDTTIIPQYKPEWSKVSSSIDEANKTLSVVVKGTAYQTEEVQIEVEVEVEVDNGDGTTTTETQIQTQTITRPRYVGTLTSTLAPEDITVFINGTEVTNITNPTIEVSAPTSTNRVAIEDNPATTDIDEEVTTTEITHTIKLSNIEEAVKQSGVPFTEWSGNVAIQIGGRGKETSTYTANVLTDQYGNQSMSETDQGQAAGTWIDVKYSDPATDRNTNNKMFADFIKPQITYKASSTIIGNGDYNGDAIYENKVSVIFDVVDKYFSETKLANDTTASSITVTIDGDAATNAAITKALAKKTIDADQTDANGVTYKANGDIYYDIDGSGTPVKIGERYELIISNLDKGDGFTYSGPMTLTFQAGTVDDDTGALTSGSIDKSGNVNNGTTITIGIDEPKDMPYIPDGYRYVEGTYDTGIVVADGDGNEYVWVEVPKSAFSAKTLRLDLDNLEGEALEDAYEAIERDLNKYTSSYSYSSFEDKYQEGEDDLVRSTTGLESVEAYNNLKNSMLKSVFKNGGFYVGRYETGIEEEREMGTTQTPVIKQHAYPYNYVSLPQAQELADGFTTTGLGYQSNVLFGVQRELVLKYIETKEVEQGAELDDAQYSIKTNSKSWGNYVGSQYTTNANSKYNKCRWLEETGANHSSVSGWNDGPYNQDGEVDNFALLTTGSSDQFAKQNIYDLAGNLNEWTLERKLISSSDSFGGFGGGSYISGRFSANESVYAFSNARGTSNLSWLGFRVALFKDEDTFAGGEEPAVVDVVDPIWKADNIVIDESNKQVRVDLTATDKYYESNSLDTGDITVYIDGEKVETTLNVKKALTTPVALDEPGTGVKYTLTITDWEEAAKQVAKGKDYFEWSGTTKIEIAANTIEDEFGNTSNKQEFTLGHADFVAPKVEKAVLTTAQQAEIQAQDLANKTETIIFNVMDKYIKVLETQEEIDAIAEQISVYIDNELATGITKTITKVQNFTATINGASRTVGQQYKLVLSGFEQAARNAKDYKDWSGTVSIKVAEGAVGDLGPKGDGTTPNINEEKTIEGDFVDYIKPDLEYIHSASDIDTTNKKYTMTFNITDKYYSTGEIDIADLSISMKNGQYERYKDANGDWQYKTDANGKRIPIVYDLKSITGITITLSSNDIYAPTGTKITDLATGDIVSVSAVNTYQIGNTYTLTIEGLENLAYDEALTTANYSGIIDVGLTAGVMKDHGPAGNDVSPNGNIGTTITSGVNVESGITSASSSTPYIPEGYSQLEGTDLNTGLVIEHNQNGNQFVWIEVPRTSTVYKTAGIQIRDFTDENYDKIEDDLHQYTSAERIAYNSEAEFNSEDEFPTDELVREITGIENRENYKELKQTMLKSIYQNQGFYIGRFETGIDYSEEPRKVSGQNEEPKQNPVIKQNAYPYSNVTVAQAQELSTRFSSRDYTSSLMFGVQGDLIMKYLETKGVDSKLLYENSCSWGNYYPNRWEITNEDAKYNVYDNVNSTMDDEWYDAYGLKNNNIIILSTGASESFKKQNIYDLAGNMREGTLEYSGNPEQPETFRGGMIWQTGMEVNNNAASRGSLRTPVWNFYTYGFRVALYRNTDTPVPAEIDVVDPRWEKVSTYAAAREHIVEEVQDPDYPDDPTKTILQRTGETKSTATIKFRGTDTYWGTSTLTADDIKVVVNGLEITDGSITKSNFTATPLYEERLLNGINVENIQYGIEYTITIEGFDQNANQVKIRIPKGKMVDAYGNDSESTDFILYNVLRKEEFIATDLNGDGEIGGHEIPFLGESEETTIYSKDATDIEPVIRNHILQITFVDSTEGSKEDNVKSVWDVSAQGDKSILAWKVYDTVNGSYNVYIGSDDEIFANQDSSCLFKAVRKSVAGTSNVIENLNLLNTSSVTNMASMFEEMGWHALERLELGDFDTSNVTNMQLMFGKLGVEKLKLLDLGNKFDTSKVTDMSMMLYGAGDNSSSSITLNLGNKFDTSNVVKMNYMFWGTGKKGLTELDLGDKFNTQNVEKMQYMFSEMKALTSLDLGDKFDTSKVTNMSYMFQNTGYTALTSLNLGDKFNTSKVTNMSNMFQNTGYTALTSLDLGDQFYTTRVTDMTNMFNGTGATAMTSLDLGPAFTKISNTNTDFMTGAGKPGELTIYAPEAIYANQKAFKLNNVVVTP